MNTPTHLSKTKTAVKVSLSLIDSPSVRVFVHPQNQEKRERVLGSDITAHPSSVAQEQPDMKMIKVV